jgi:hypothetical protein
LLLSCWFYAGLLAGFAIGLALAVLAGPARGYLLMLACEIAGASTYFLAFDIPTSGTSGEPFLTFLTTSYILPAAACYSIIPASLGIASAALTVLLHSRLLP